MRNALTFTMVVLLAFASACGQKTNETATNERPAGLTGQAASTTAAGSLTPEQLGELGAQIRKSPSSARDLLSQRGLTPESYEAQIRKVTEDPDAAKRYAASYRKASA